MQRPRKRTATPSLTGAGASPPGDLVEGDAFRELGRLLGEEAELLDFAQAVIDHDLVSDFDTIQELANDAFEKGTAGEVPPLNIFEMGQQKIQPVHATIEPSAPAQEIFDVPVASYSQLPSLDDLSQLSKQDAARLLKRLLAGARELGVSDLHLSAGARPFIRNKLRVEYIGKKPLDAEIARQLNTALLEEWQLEWFQTKPDYDYALALSDKNRFRVNLMVHKEGVAGTYRLVPSEIKGLEDLGFSNAKTIKNLLAHHNGLILVTGPLGSGKTTTLAALVETINRQRKDHIITVEDPIEIIQECLGCNVTQREVGGVHTATFASALKAALREDPDIIVIGELRDLETIEMAITAAETGHLVIGTLHTRDAATTLGRLLDVFPPSQQAQIRSMTAESLRGIICQRLLPSVDGGLCVGVEVMLNTIAVANVIPKIKCSSCGPLCKPAFLKA